jgi:hypothetical protein
MCCMLPKLSFGGDNLVAGNNLIGFSDATLFSKAFYDNDCQADSSYFKMLEKIEDILNSEIENIRFKNYEGCPMNYLIADLTDSLNIGKNLPNDERGFIKFTESHFYHVVPALKHMSYSFIIYFEKGRIMRTFKYVNCKKRGDSLEEVLEFANSKLKHDKEKADIIRRIRNYRSSVEFEIPMDNYGDSEPIDCN